MDITDELIDSSPGEDLYDGQQLVLIYLKFPIGKFDGGKALDAIYQLDDILREVIDGNKIGQYDGHEFASGPDEESVTFLMYGPDADVIYAAIIPLFLNLPKLPGSYILKRYGDIGSGEEKKSFI